jgi:hypothetical protein
MSTNYIEIRDTHTHTKELIWEETVIERFHKDNLSWTVKLKNNNWDSATTAVAKW